MKSIRSLERIFKGVANHWRIEILLAIKKNPDMTLLAISQKLDCNLKTIAEHTRRLVIAGLVRKRRLDNMTLHHLSPYGEKVVKILQEF
jgi:DNA-binding HxlR family transcriptional regulator